MKTSSEPSWSLIHSRASIKSVVGPDSATLNQGGDLPLLQQVPSQFSPSQSGSFGNMLIGVYEFGFPDSQYQLFPKYAGAEAPGLLEQGQLA